MDRDALIVLVNDIIDSRMVHPESYIIAANSIPSAGDVSDMVWEVQHQIYRLQEEVRRLKQPFWLRAWNYWRDR